MQNRAITGRYTRGPWNESKRAETIEGPGGWTRHETDVYDLYSGTEDFYDGATAVTDKSAEHGLAVRKPTKDYKPITEAKSISMARIADPYNMRLDDDPHMKPVGGAGSGAGAGRAAASEDRPRASRVGKYTEQTVSQSDLDAAANALMTPPLMSEPFTTPRYQDLGMMVDGVSQADQRAYRALTSKKPQRLFGISSEWTSSYGRFDDESTYFGAPEGDLALDATKTGEWTDPYTGKVYEVFDNNFLAPDGDFRSRDSGKQRQFNGLMGGFGPSESRFKRRENPIDEILPEDVPRETPEEYWRLRAYESMHQTDLLGPHRGEHAWTDGEGYAHVPTTMPGNSMGLNELVRKYPMPDMHLHHNREALYASGLGANTVEGLGIEGGIVEPAALTVLAPTIPFNRSEGVGGVDGLEGTQFMADAAKVYAEQTIRNYGEHPYQRTHGTDGADHYGLGTIDAGGLVSTWIPGMRTDFLLEIGRVMMDSMMDNGAYSPSEAALLRTNKAEQESERYRLGEIMMRMALEGSEMHEGGMLPSEFLGDRNVLKIMYEVWNAGAQRIEGPAEGYLGPMFKPETNEFDRYTTRREDDYVYGLGVASNIDISGAGDLLDPSLMRSMEHFVRDSMREGKHNTRALNRSSAPLAVAAGEDTYGTSNGLMLIDTESAKEGALRSRFFESTFAKDYERGIDAVAFGDIQEATFGAQEAYTQMLHRRVPKPFVMETGIPGDFSMMGPAKRNVMGMDREITTRKSVIAR